MPCLINICQKCESCSNLVSKPYPHLQFTNCLFHMDIGLTLQAFRLQVNRVTQGPSHHSASPTHTPVISFYYLCWTPHLSVIINVCFLSLQRFPSTGSPSSKTLHCWRTSVIDRRSVFEVFHAIYWFPLFRMFILENISLCLKICIFLCCWGVITLKKQHCCSSGSIWRNLNSVSAVYFMSLQAFILRNVLSLFLF